MVQTHPQRLTVEDDSDDRYSRLRLIPWWDQELLEKAKVMVVGAGALGNEILKNLALVGVGNIVVLDMDTVEHSNLSRSVLFRSSDEGKSKAQAAAAMVNSINPGIKVQWLDINVIYELGLGLYRWADVVIGGLDNREARLAINQSCWKVGKPWVDGAIEVLFGVARVFIPPHSACYECTMNEMDRKLLALRRSCALLSRDDMVQGKVPTTPTIASIIGGIQVQEALKIIHHREDMPVLKGKGYFFNGLNYDSYLVEYDRREDCMSHETYQNIENLNISIYDTTMGELLASLRSKLGREATLELEKELLWALDCEACGSRELLTSPLARISEKAAICPHCKLTRTPQMTHSITGDEPFLNLKLSEIGIPPLEVVATVHQGEYRYFELSGDRGAVLGKVG